MYLKKAENNRAYPGYVECGGGWDNANHSFDVAEGRFFPIEGGYVLLMSVNAITGFTKTDNFTKGCLMSLEIHRTRYKLNAWDNTAAKFVEKEVDPDQLEILMCDWLDKIRTKEDNPVDKCWAGTFSAVSSAPLVSMIEASEAGCQLLFKGLAYVDANLIKEAPKARAGFGSGSKSSGFSELQKAEQRMEFIVSAVANYFGCEKSETFTKDMKGVMGLLGNYAIADYHDFLVFYSILSLALGTPTTPSAAIGIPATETHEANKDKSTNTPF